MEEVYPETNRKLIRPQINFWAVGIKLTVFVMINALLTAGVLYVLSDVSWYIAMDTQTGERIIHNVF